MDRAATPSNASATKATTTPSPTEATTTTSVQSTQQQQQQQIQNKKQQLIATRGSSTMVVADCNPLEMDTTTTDSKGFTISETSTEEGGSLINGQGREPDVAIEQRNGCIGVGVGNGISCDDKASTASADTTNYGGRGGGFLNHEAQVFADHGKEIYDLLKNYLIYLFFMQSRINSIAIGERKTVQGTMATQAII